MTLSKCLACGAPCDGDVCDDRCANELDARKAAERAAYLEANGLRECGYCGADYAPTPRTKDICDTCLKDAGF